MTRLEMESSLLRKSLILEKSILALSPEGRPVDLYKITGVTKNIKNENKHQLKKYVIITSRVHPGETQSSFLLNGLLKQLILNRSFRKSKNHQKILQEFIFIIIPILNPDGVYRGHYRQNIYGSNLNRSYKNPDPVEEPVIFAFTNYIKGNLILRLPNFLKIWSKRLEAYLAILIYMDISIRKIFFLLETGLLFG